MNINHKSASDKHVRVSPETWEKLRIAAYSRKTFIKSVFEDIMKGKINPVTFEDISQEENKDEF